MKVRSEKAGRLELAAVKLAHRVAQAERRTNRGWAKLARDAKELSYRLQQRAPEKWD